jgi:hypothetical protein
VGRGGQGHGAGRHTPDPASTRRIRPPHTGSRPTLLVKAGRSAKVSHSSPRPMPLAEASCSAVAGHRSPRLQLCGEGASTG